MDLGYKFNTYFSVIIWHLIDRLEHLFVRIRGINKEPYSGNDPLKDIFVIATDWDDIISQIIHCCAYVPTQID